MHWNRLKICSTPLVLAAAFAIAILAPGCASPPPEGTEIGDTCPDIAGADSDGKPIRLSDYRGKVVLVSFWGTWCGPCRALLPRERARVQTQFAGRPFTILGIATDSPERLQEFLKSNYLPWPNIADGAAPGTIAREWKVKRFPSAMLIDHAGVIIGKWFSGADPEDVWQQVERAVAAAQS